MEREAARPIRGVNDMTEKLAFIIFAFIVPTTVLIIAGLVVAVVILIGAILLFRSPGKNYERKFLCHVVHPSDRTSGFSFHSPLTDTHKGYPYTSTQSDSTPPLSQFKTYLNTAKS